MVGCQKFVHYIRMLCTGCFILNGIVVSYFRMFLLHLSRKLLQFQMFIVDNAKDARQESLFQAFITNTFHPGVHLLQGTVTGRENQARLKGLFL